ncbi:hypothetical protein [Sphingorhabdus sp. SMR4y]|nr:hypothetical protein [Sphingorhabdus sp. SMR4y]ASK88459.1 hypothetical protein SPHFLASMR4Y_01712 [Sphingorhabdus sp. SMR4y]
MTEEQQAEYDRLKAKLAARRHQPGYKKNVEQIEARLRELEDAS